MDGLRNAIANMTPKGRLMAAGSALGVVVVVFLLIQMASAKSYTTMLTGLDPAQTGKITAALDSKGISYELQNNGTALAVDKSQVAQARIALASQGLPQSAQPGMELMDKQSLGASDFQQQVTYQRALEGQLAQAISQIDGVGNATVQLVLPQNQLFQDQQSQAKASVLLSGDSSNLQPGAARGIAQLVASSVTGLSAQNVTITDATGAMVWPSADSGASSGQLAATAKQAAEARYAQQTESNLDAMLTQTLGPGKAQVQVNDDLNTNQVTQDQLQYGKRVPVHTQNETETLRGGGGGGGGGANIPSFAQAGGGNSNYNHRVTETDNDVSKTVTHTQVAPGTVQRQSVAVLIDNSVPAAEVASIRSAVQNAAGINTRRGDTLAISQVAFAKPPTPKSGPVPPGLLGIAKYVGAGLAALAFLIFITRHLRRREDQALTGEPVWLREIHAPTTLAELETAPTRARPAVTQPQGRPIRGELDNILEREPERVAAQVRAWMNED
jgi:flagellar M-ring protein FliF